MGASCLAQTNALFRKNLAIQRRDCKTNCCLICFPFLICLLLGGAQIAVTMAYLGSARRRPPIDCHYCTASTNGSSKNTVGGLHCPAECPLPIAPKWPPVLQLPADSDLDLDLGLSRSTNLPDASIGSAKSSAATFLVTGSNQSFAEGVMSNMFPKHDASNFAPDISTLADFALGTNAMRLVSHGADEYGSDFDEYSHLFFLQRNCTANSTLSFPVQEGRRNFTKDAKCIEGLFLWRENLSVVNSELYRSYYQGDKETNGIASTYDLTSSDLNQFNLIVSYNPTYKGVTQMPISVIFFFIFTNLSSSSTATESEFLATLQVSNAHLQLRGNDTTMRFEFVKDMPRAAQPEMPIDISFLLGKVVFVWIIMLLFPVILSNLVYEKQQKLRTIMKMHGLGDIAYWTISYCYFLLLSLLYMLLLVLFGYIVGIKLFRLNDYRVQLVIYFAYINLQISFAFLMATYFSNVTTASVTGYLFTIGSGFLGEYLFRPIFEDISLSRSWTTLMEFFPRFSLYRIIYEFTPPPSVFIVRTFPEYSGET